MIYILTILYSVFLGAIVRNLLSSKYTANPKTVSIELLVLKDKVSIVTGIFILFLIDWITFLMIFPPSSQFTFQIQDGILTLFYIPTITFLAFALILSLDTRKEKYCLSLSLYYLVSTIAELCWIVMTVKTMKDSIGADNYFSILAISIVYMLFKGAFGVIFLFRHWNHTFLNPTFLTFLSLVFKPALIIFLSQTTNIRQLIQ